MTPKARKKHLLVHEVDDEMVVYDKKRKRAHRLNHTAARVWSLLDGKRTTNEIAGDLDVNESVVTLSVDHLANAHLLESSEPLSVSRRKALRRIASTAAVGFLLPAVTSIAAPFAAQAQSGWTTTATTTTPFMIDPSTKNDCKNDGWKQFGFYNQGQCTAFVNTGNDSR